MEFGRNTLIGLLMLLATVLVGGLPAHAQESATHCFRMSMVDDGKPVQAPKVITFADGSEREEVEAREKQYCVPESMMNANTLDLSFETAGSRFNLFHVRMDVFDSDWDISFGGKRYAKDEHVGKGINADESCTLHIHGGEEEKVLTLKGCRLALRQGR